jgi:DNA polymerase-3 subunit gamma/tau
MLVSMLETGEWAVEGNEIVIKVASTAAVIDMSLGAEAKRVAIASASGAAGRPLKLKVLPGGTAQAARPRVSTASNGGGRARAEQEPIVRRLREKFGAEIRTIIDQRDKK